MAKINVAQRAIEGLSRGVRKRRWRGLYETINRYHILKLWCPEPDLNRHDRNDRGILSPLCLPISPPGQGDDIEGREAYHANP